MLQTQWGMLDEVGIRILEQVQTMMEEAGAGRPLAGIAPKITSLGPSSQEVRAHTRLAQREATTFSWPFERHDHPLC